jgi:hypothetical protein
MMGLLSRLTILAAALAACIGSASAQTAYVCTGFLPSSSTPYLSVTVPAGATCNLPAFGTVSVTNNVEVESGASLFLEAPLTLTFVVNGSLLGRNANTIDLVVPSSTSKVNIVGSVNLTGTGAVAPRGISIGGTLLITNSNKPRLGLVVSRIDACDRLPMGRTVTDAGS